MNSRMIRKDLVLHQGKYWEWWLRLLADGDVIDTSSWSARMQIRADSADAGAPVILDLSKANGRVQTGIMPRDPAPINILLTIPDTTNWSAWPLELGRAVYELEIIDASPRVLDIGFYGFVTLHREVVR